jgi:hypothetical protein
VVVCESSAGWASNGMAARYQHDFSSNYIGGSSLSRATHRRLGEPERLTAVPIDSSLLRRIAIGCASTKVRLLGGVADRGGGKSAGTSR